MIKYFILIGIILVMSILPQTESMDIMQQFKTSHKNILNQITNIRNTESALYNNAHKYPGKTKQIVDEINRLAMNRDQLFKSIQDQSTIFQKITPEITQEDKFVNEIDSELSKIKYKKKKTDLANINRATEINNYYNERSLAYISLFKTILMFFIPLFITAALIKYNIFPSSLGKTLMVIIVIIMIIFSYNKYMDILARDNMNFNDYDFDTIYDDNLNNLGKTTGYLPKMCVDQACCAKGTIYDEDLGQCRLPTR